MSAQSVMRSGDFASSRRGGLTAMEVVAIKEERARARPTPWQALANRYGRSVIDIMGVANPPANDPEPQPPRSKPQPAAPFKTTDRQNLAWGPEATALMVEQYGNIPNELLAARFGISVNALHGKAYRMGITKKRGFNGERRKGRQT